ncbi:hypothetical protein A2U01_0016645 [Trifolium medium]|uniref:Uncharacterized protein n=1 Tax=Trifolium medium TaxID=97028 RepID=A0A392NB21_9FABA|nr:hypothetical protein [Trifolium medium]
MASISMAAVAPWSIKNACGEGEWFGDTYLSCIIEEEDYHNGGRDSYSEGDDDDDSGYDYAPAQGFKLRSASAIAAAVLLMR